MAKGVISGYPVAQEAVVGTTIAVELMTRPGASLIDYVTLVSAPGNVAERAEAAPAHDFTAEDATFRLTSPSLAINGKSVALPPIQAIDGVVIWVYLPNRGKFTLSLAPRPSLGFRKAGEIRGSSLAFSDSGDQFTMTSADRIAGGGAYNLYVLHDPVSIPFTPEERERVQLGSAARVGK